MLVTGPGAFEWPAVASSANTREVVPSPRTGTARKVASSARKPGVDAFARLFDNNCWRCCAALAPVIAV